MYTCITRGELHGYCAELLLAGDGNVLRERDWSFRRCGSEELALSFFLHMCTVCSTLCTRANGRSGKLELQCEARDQLQPRCGWAAHTYATRGESEAWCRICLMLPSTYLRDGAALITLHLPSKMCATCASHTMHRTDQRQQARLSPKVTHCSEQ
jgi:hypothetical protein